MSFHVWCALEDFQDEGNDPVTLIINSEGGVLHDMLSIVDAIKSCEAPVRTIGTGVIASAATCILSAGEPGMRYLTKNCSVMMHEASFGANNNITGFKAELKEVERLQSIYEKLLAEFTGRTRAEIKEYMNGKDYWMSASDAIHKLGLADKILKPGSY